MTAAGLLGPNLVMVYFMNAFYQNMYDWNPVLLRYLLIEGREEDDNATRREQVRHEIL